MNGFRVEKVLAGKLIKKTMQKAHSVPAFLTGVEVRYVY